MQAQTQFILLTLTSYNKKKKDVLPMNQQHRFIFWGVLLIVVLLSVSSITFPIFVAQTVKNQNVICIDAGHGGSDPGKVGNSNILEKDINLSLALKLQKLLEKKNYKVYMTRNGDYNLADSKENEKRSDLSNRKQLIFENDPMAVISIHQNSYPSSDVHGAQVFYPQGSEKSKQLADHIQSALIKGLDSMIAFLPNTVSSTTVQIGWPMQMILPITCSVRWKLSTRTESWSARRTCSPNGPSSPIRQWLLWIRQAKHWRCPSRKKPA